jgi:hypothetical protein
VQLLDALLVGLAVGQWLQVKTITSARAEAYSFSACRRPSTPGRSKSGAAAPMARVGCAGASSAAGRTDAALSSMAAARMRVFMDADRTASKAALRSDVVVGVREGQLRLDEGAGGRRAVDLLDRVEPICSAAFRLSRTWSVRETVVLSQQMATGTPPPGTCGWDGAPRA